MGRMKEESMTRKAILVSIFLGLISFAVRPAAAQSNTSQLVGSWQLTLTPNSSTPPAVPMPALATFTPDGSVVETDGSEAAPAMVSMNVVYGTPGHGIWQPAPAIGNLFIQFISLMVNPNASLHARRTVTIMGALDATGNNFKGTYDSHVVDPTGHTIVMSAGAVTGQKIPHPLLP
jgi:hypothetical protein